MLDDFKWPEVEDDGDELIIRYSRARLSDRRHVGRRAAIFVFDRPLLQLRLTLSSSSSAWNGGTPPG
jgi:hypothetical protein